VAAGSVYAVSPICICRTSSTSNHTFAADVSHPPSVPTPRQFAPAGTNWYSGLTGCHCQARDSQGSIAVGTQEDGDENVIKQQPSFCNVRVESPWSVRTHTSRLGGSRIHRLQSVRDITCHITLSKLGNCSELLLDASIVRPSTMCHDWSMAQEHGSSGESGRYRQGCIQQPHRPSAL
jgi:hypothetical protein